MVLLIGLIFMPNKFFKLSINSNMSIKNELKFLHISNLIVFMPYLSYI